MIIKFIRWFFSSTKKEIIEDIDVYSKLIELDENINRLNSENIETSNVLYELGNSIDALDTRIDILTLQKWMDESMYEDLNNFEKALSHFGTRVDIICAMEMGGRIDAETAYKNIKDELKDLKKARKRQRKDEDM